MKGCVLNRIDIFTDFEFQEYGKVNIRGSTFCLPDKLRYSVIDIDTSSEIVSNILYSCQAEYQNNHSCGG